MLRKLQGAKGFTLVELMIVVAIIGILAAIAIPAFLRSVKKSKTAEAEQTMRKMADGAKSYYTSEQKYSVADGDQPWHSGGSTLGVGNSPGNPVPGPLYVFPGGDDFIMGTHDIAGVDSGGSGNAPITTAPGCTAAVPVNGGKAPALGVQALMSGDVALKVLNKLKVGFSEPTYFEYNYDANGEGPNARADYWACADFDNGVTNNHQTLQTIYVLEGEVSISGATTWNEFE